jgi:hypothetical protein
MTDWLLHTMPEMMARYEYMHSLLSWLQEWINEVNQERPAFPWVLPDPLLIASLERAGQENKSVSILRFLAQVKKQAEDLEKVNRDHGNANRAMGTLMNLTEKVPALEKQLKRELIWSGIKADLYFMVLVLILILLLYALTMRVAT